MNCSLLGRARQERKAQPSQVILAEMQEEKKKREGKEEISSKT